VEREVFSGLRINHMEGVGRQREVSDLHKLPAVELWVLTDINRDLTQTGVLGKGEGRGGVHESDDDAGVPRGRRDEERGAILRSSCSDSASPDWGRGVGDRFGFAIAEHGLCLESS
jgi:hypothetical protein